MRGDTLLHASFGFGEGRESSCIMELHLREVASSHLMRFMPGCVEGPLEGALLGVLAFTPPEWHVRPLA